VRRRLLCRTAQIGKTTMKNEYPNPMVTYDALDRAFDFFNRRLFGGELRSCLITVQRRRTACGFFAPRRFRSHDESDIADEIGLDPRYWGPPRTDTENLSTLIHEMVHLWQHHYGKPSSGGYHNRQFARKMFEVGLVASSTGKPGGKATGTRMSDYIRAGGPFDRACSELITSGFVIPYVQIMSEAERARLVRRRSRLLSKTTYTCPHCHPLKHVWGKPLLHIICGDCGARFEADQDNESVATTNDALSNLLEQETPVERMKDHDQHDESGIFGRLNDRSGSDR
jgi:transcription elongation factor Elf1